MPRHEHAPDPVTRRPLVIVALVIVALVIAASLVILGLTRSDPLSSSVINPSVPAPGAAGLSRGAWFQLAATSVDTAAGIVTTGFNLTFGHTNGSISWPYAVTYPVPLAEPLDRTAIPTIAGASDQTITVAYYDGRSSWLRVLDVSTGGLLSSVELDGIIAAAAVDHSIGTRYIVRHDATTLVGDGVWRVGGDGVAERMVPPDVSFDAKSTEGERTWLDLTPDGSMLLRWVCGGEACRLDGVDTGTGQRRFRTDGLDFGLLLGTGDRHAITTSMPIEARTSCLDQAQGSAQPRCPFTIIDLETGRVQLGEPFCDDDVVVAHRDPLTVIAASTHPACGSGGYGLVAFDIERGQSTTFNPTANGLQLVPDLSDRGTSLDGAPVLAPDGEFPFGIEGGNGVVVDVPQ